MKKKYETLKGSTHFTEEFQFHCVSADHDRSYRGWHAHDFNEMVLIASGKGYHKTLSGKRRIKKGSLLFVDPSVPHGYLVNETLRLVNFIFSSRFLAEIDRFCSFQDGKNGKLLHGLFINHRKKPLLLKPDEFILCEHLVSKIQHEIKQRETGFHGMVRSLFAELVVYLIRSEYNIGSAAEQTKESESEQRIEKTIQYIEANFREKLTLDDIAVCASYSPAYMSNFFKKKTGYALFEYINEVRVQKACELLKKSDATVLQVAYEVGFNSISLFNRTFKKLMGITPRLYRKTPPESI